MRRFLSANTPSSRWPLGSPESNFVVTEKFDGMFAGNQISAGVALTGAAREFELRDEPFAISLSMAESNAAPTSPLPPEDPIAVRWSLTVST